MQTHKTCLQTRVDVLPVVCEFVYFNV